MKEKKVEVEINGKIIRVSEHMLSDIAKFGGTFTKRVRKETPAELLQMPKKLILNPVAFKEEKLTLEVTPESSVTANFDPPTEALADLYPGDEVKKVRKTPVRSKAKK